MGAPVSLAPELVNDRSPDLEKALLSAVLGGRGDNWGTILEVCPDLDAWTVTPHRVIAYGCQRLHSRGAKITGETVMEELTQVAWADVMSSLRTGERLNGTTVSPSDSALAAIGSSAIADLIVFDAWPQVRAGAEMLAAYLRGRRAKLLVSLALDALNRVDLRTRLPEVLDKLVNDSSALMGNGRTTQTMSEAGEQALAEHDAAKLSGDTIAGTWGIDGLDSLIRLSGARLAVVAARPGCGKTSLMLMTAAATTARLGGESVALVTLEMPAEDLARIMIGRQIGVGRAAIERGWMSETQRQAFQEATTKWKENDVSMKGHGERCNVEDICAWIRGRHRRSRGKLHLVAIDYLQLIQGTNPRQNENDRLGEITRRLKLLANELRICVLLLSQLNRSSVKEKRDVRSDDLRGSGCIEQDADSILFLMGDSETPSATISIDAKVAKNRGGRTGNLAMEFARAEGQTLREIDQAAGDRFQRMKDGNPSAEDVF